MKKASNQSPLRRKVLSIFLVLTLVFGAVAAFAGEASAFGATVSDNQVVYIRNVRSGKYIDVPGGTVAANKELQIYIGNETAAQQWRVRTRSDGWSVIRSMVNEDYVLSVANGSDCTTLKLTNVAGVALANMPASCLFLIFDATDYGFALFISKNSMNAGNAKVMGIVGNATANVS